MAFSQQLVRGARAASFAGLALLAGPALAQNKIVFKSLSDLEACATHHSYDPGACLEPLQAYAKAHPKQLFEIGKKARLHFRNWVALQFFEPALGKSPRAAQCQDEDLGLAVVSGLATPTGDASQLAATRVFSGACHAALRPAVEKELAQSPGASYVARHACPVLATQGSKPAACEPPQEVVTTPAQPDVLPVVDLATVKFGVIKVYAGPEGERLTMADIPAVPGAFALRFDGVRGEFNGKTLVHQESPRGSGFDYWTLLEGKRWATLTVRGNGYKSYQAYVPASRETLRLHYSERDSKAATEAQLRP
jgi:hypothetical protein